MKIGNNGTDYNYTWLRFGDANNFCAKKDASVVYPIGSSKTPNPRGLLKRAGLEFIVVAITWISSGSHQPLITTVMRFLSFLKVQEPT